MRIHPGFFGDFLWREEVGSKNLLVTGFGISPEAPWIDVPILCQTELECGPRTMWNMSVLSKARNHHILLSDIFAKLCTMGGISRESSAQESSTGAGYRYLLVLLSEFLITLLSIKDSR